jgi:hypothetical protein
MPANCLARAGNPTGVGVRRHVPPMKRAGVSAAVAAALLSLAAGSAAASPELRLESLDGAPIGVHGSGPTILAFWRADCAPCLIELGQARAYADAARPARLLFVGLQDRAALEAAAAKAHAPPSFLARAIGAPSQILTELEGPPPRLPLAVALDPSGRICARRTGLLGTDQVRAWVRSCGASHAHG